ncbi:MAG: decaprenyl-phosphate phosphoribosyltransferase [Solirubrobacteraceae bacterium]
MPLSSPQPYAPPTAAYRSDAESDRLPVTRLRHQSGGTHAWVRAVRIRQWVKNLLVFAAPAAAGALGRPGVLGRVALAFAVFCLLASGAYLINDARDAAEDRRHPIKRHRPVASGTISATHAIRVGAVAVLAGLVLSLSVGDRLLGVACAYCLLNVAYTSWLRRVAIADIAAIAGAFVLRALAGGIAAEVMISRWFILVVSFAALFVAAGKRYADFVDPGSRRSRPVLEQYNPDFLRLVITVACAVALGAYALWAFAAGVTLWRELTIVPFTVALLRYGLLVTAGSAGAPEKILFSDDFVQLTGVAWLVLFGLGA